MSNQTQLLARDSTGARSAAVDLKPGQRVSIGRLGQNDLPIVWDIEVSREHAVVELCEDGLKVACLPSGKNPIFFNGEQSREVMLKSGQQFQIGQTVFRFEAPEPDELPAEPVVEGASQVEEHCFRDFDTQQFNVDAIGQQIKLLCDLPDLIAKAKTDADLAQLLCGLLLKAIPLAVAVAAIQYDKETIDRMKKGEALGDQALRPATMRVQTRDTYDGRFVPSRRLVARTFGLSSATVYIWSGAGESNNFTMAEQLDWAFCVPIPGESTVGWCLYVSGQGGKNNVPVASREDLEPDVRFTQLVTQFIGSVRSVRMLQEQKTQLSSFFSPQVIENMMGGADVLAPAERDITVLFCDVRGFSKLSEKHRDNLLHLLSCVREALSSMTGGIMKYNGAIADFQGDAALGFWGWPVSLAEGAVPACLAALAIQDEFMHPERHGGKLDGISVGLGVAHGRAVAGQIGTDQQAKIGVFGPVVNQGSRLEGLTKQFGVSICLDERSADFARKLMPKTKGRVRRLARVRPKGMDVAITVSQLLPGHEPQSASKADSDDRTNDGPAIRASIEINVKTLQANLVTDEHITAFEAALDLVIAGNWTAALAQLNQLPDDGPKKFLLDQMARTNNVPPPDWDGAFSMTEK